MSRLSTIRRHKQPNLQASNQAGPNSQPPPPPQPPPSPFGRQQTAHVGQASPILSSSPMRGKFVESGEQASGNQLLVVQSDSGKRPDTCLARTGSFKSNLGSSLSNVNHDEPTESEPTNRHTILKNRFRPRDRRAAQSDELQQSSSLATESQDGSNLQQQQQQSSASGGLQSTIVSVGYDFAGVNKRNSEGKLIAMSAPMHRHISCLLRRIKLAHSPSIQYI